MSRHEDMYSNNTRDCTLFNLFSRTTGRFSPGVAVVYLLYFVRVRTYIAGGITPTSYEVQQILPYFLPSATKYSRYRRIIPGACPKPAVLRSIGLGLLPTQNLRLLCLPLLSNRRCLPPPTPSSCSASELFHAEPRHYMLVSYVTNEFTTHDVYVILIHTTPYRALAGVFYCKAKKKVCFCFQGFC